MIFFSLLLLLLLLACLLASPVSCCSHSLPAHPPFSPALPVSRQASECQGSAQKGESLIKGSAAALANHCAHVLITPPCIHGVHTHVHVTAIKTKPLPSTRQQNNDTREARKRGENKTKQKNPSTLVVVGCVENAQNGEEQVDHIQVQRDGRRNLLLNVVVTHDQLRVYQDVARKDESADDAIAHFDPAAVREEHGHHSEQDQHPQRPEQVWDPAREVVFALARKQTQCNEYAKCEQHGLQNDPALREGNHNRDRVGFHGCESREKGQVGRVRFALPECEPEEYECTDNRHP
ncbi:unnamed protein product [Periconia digitata]|uniref:Secreted protein n=1 Tax=Periconia digitata TaxID=1303443 RepID=A0A9W4U6B5_9PLEO|nr:unnamed protein product [Periconia digitata]